MKKIFLLLIFPCISICSFAQNSNQYKVDSVCQLVKKYFNEKNSSQLYALTGAAFKNALSPDAFKTVCDNNLFPLGEIKQVVYEKNENGVGKYKAVFGSVNLSLLISLDKNDKIETFLFKPYN